MPIFSSHNSDYRIVEFIEFKQNKTKKKHYHYANLMNEIKVLHRIIYNDVKWEDIHLSMANEKQQQRI